MPGRHYHHYERRDHTTKADTGKVRTLRAKLGLIAHYIRTQAEDFGDNIDAVPCPPPEEWERIAGGNNRRLPTGSQIELYANAQLKEIARSRHGGDIRAAAFAVAKSLVKRGEL